MTFTTQHSVITERSLITILRTARPPKSQEQNKLRETIRILAKGFGYSTKTDGYGNLYAKLGPTKTMFTAHLDTVDRQPKQKTLKVNAKTQIIRTTDGECLGADDGTGVWLMLKMMEAKTRGLFAFFLDEEIGGRGSNYASSKFEHNWEQYDRCISFDRKGYGDVITHQACGRSASDDFAKALSKELNFFGKFKFKPNDGGTFTDSANFSDLISECTNLSVGYFGQHFATETQDLSFAIKLAEVLPIIDWENLPTERKPGEDDPYEPMDWGRYYDQRYGTPSTPDLPPSGLSELFGYEPMMEDVLYDCPDLAAMTLVDQFAITAEDFGIDFDDAVSEYEALVEVIQRYDINQLVSELAVDHHITSDEFLEAAETTYETIQ